MATMANARMINANCTMLNNVEKYGKLVGNKLYLSYNTLLDLRCITDKLGCAMNQPAARNWRSMKAVIPKILANIHTGIVYPIVLQRPSNLAFSKALFDAIFGGDHEYRNSRS